MPSKREILIAQNDYILSLVTFGKGKIKYYAFRHIGGNQRILTRTVKECEKAGITEPHVVFNWFIGATIAPLWEKRKELEEALEDVNAKIKEISRKRI